MYENAPLFMFVWIDAWKQPEPDDLRFAFSGPDAANASSIQLPLGFWLKYPF